MSPKGLGVANEGDSLWVSVCRLDPDVLRRRKARIHRAANPYPLYTHRLHLLFPGNLMYLPDRGTNYPDRCPFPLRIYRN